MTHKILLFVLVSATCLTVSGQVRVGPRIESAPFPYQQSLPNAAPSAALSWDGEHFLLAFSAPTDGRLRVHVVRLDRGGPAIEQPAVLPLALGTSDSHAEAPAIAFNGDEFLILWREVVAFTDTAHLVVAMFGRDGRLTSTPLSIGKADLEVAPIVAWNGDVFLAGSGRRLLRLTADGRPLDEEFMDPLKVNGIAANASEFGVISHLSKRTVTPPNCFKPCAVPPPPPTVTDTHMLNLTRVFRSSVQVGSSFFNPRGAAIASDGVDYLVAWYDGAAEVGGVIRGARIGQDANFDDPFNRFVIGGFGPDFIPGREYAHPQISVAGPGTFVVVWDAIIRGPDRDVSGAVVTLRAGERPDVAFLDIASTSADERRPFAQSCGESCVLVGFEIVEGAQRRLAGRVVSIAPHPRRRAIR